MGELTDKIKGNTNEAIGKGKQAVADSNNDASLAAEGKAQESKGKGQQAAGEVKGKLGNDI
ncbi:MAG: CsbD family protein [Erythrobacter sp.]|nr:CsbD family protein [Erythrobacter sp.]